MPRLADDSVHAPAAAPIAHTFLLNIPLPACSKINSVTLQSSRLDLRTSFAAGFVEEDRLLLFPVDEVRGYAAHEGRCKLQGCAWMWLSGSGRSGCCWCPVGTACRMHSADAAA